MNNFGQRFNIKAKFPKLGILDFFAQNQGKLEYI